jgi:hypothetical protein
MSGCAAAADCVPDRSASILRHWTRVGGVAWKIKAAALSVWPWVSMAALIGLMWYLATE